MGRKEKEEVNGMTTQDKKKTELLKDRRDLLRSLIHRAATSRKPERRDRINEQIAGVESQIRELTGTKAGGR